MKKLKIGYLMDPLETLNFKKDTTFALILEAQRNQWENHYLSYEHLSLYKNNILTLCTEIKVESLPHHQYQIIKKNNEFLSLDYFDIVWMRKDPPFDRRYLHSTYLLDLAQKNGCYIVNNPTAIRDANEKIFSAWFPDCTPPTLVTSIDSWIVDFLRQHKKIILKPLNQMGGYGVVLLDRNDPNAHSLIELLTERGKQPIMAQQFLPEIAEGDKRILMIQGEPYPDMLVRVPPAGDFRGNLRIGAHAHVQPLSEKEHRIAQQVGPILKAKGLSLVGLDIIGPYLTEINVTSPTGVKEIEQATQKNVCWDIWQSLLNN